MFQFKDQKTKSMRQFSNLHHLKKAIQCLLAVLVISFLFSNSSLLHSFHVYFSTLSIHKTDRNYMFLLCNGILVFIFKNSGLIGSSTLGSGLNGQHVDMNRERQQSVLELSDRKASAAGKVALESEKGHAADNGLSATQNEDKANGSIITLEEEEEEEEEEGIGLLSKEELHRKCDEFIKKMKQGIAQPVIKV